MFSVSCFVCGAPNEKSPAAGAAAIRICCLGCSIFGGLVLGVFCLEFNIYG